MMLIEITSLIGLVWMLALAVKLRPVYIKIRTRQGK